MKLKEKVQRILLQLTVLSEISLKKSYEETISRASDNIF